MKDQTILITGAAGFIGSHLCDHLLSTTQATIIGIDCFNDFYDPNIKHQNIKNAKTSSRFKLINKDIRDTSALDHLFKTEKPDILIHLAAYAGVRPSLENPPLYYDVNITGTLNLLECCKQYNIKKVLFASSSSVYGNNEKTPFSETDPVDHPISPYATTKKAGELMCYNFYHLTQIPTACLRFFTVYGPRQRPEMAIHKFTKLIDENQPIPVFNEGNCLRDYTYIDDIIHGIGQILHHDPLRFDIVNLGESKTISTLDLIKLIELHLHKKANLKLLPAQSGDVEKTFADITHAKSVYNYNPQYPIEKGIESFISWYQAQKIKTHSTK